MPSKIKLPLSLCLSALALCSLPGCDDYDTHHNQGDSFTPYNTLVADFVHLAFVQFQDGKVKISGPYADAVTVQRQEDARLALSLSDDSLALFVSGNAMGDTLCPLHGQLSIQSNTDFALYLNGLHLHSNEGPALSVEVGQHTCYLVVPKGSTNVLTDSILTPSEQVLSDPALGCLSVHGALCLDGTGELKLYNRARPQYVPSLGDTLWPQALYAQRGLTCNYSVAATLVSLYGDAIRTAGGEVKLLKGTWKLCAGRDSLAWLSDTLTVQLSEVKAHHDSLAKYRNTVRTELRSLAAQLEAVLANENYPNDSLLLLADSINGVGNAYQYSYDSVSAALAVDTVQMDYFNTYLDSLLRHRAIETEGAPISLGEEATMTLFVHPDSIK